jgi:hypothetical protein
LFIVFNWLPVNCVREIEILVSLIGICFKIQGHYIEDITNFQTVCTYFLIGVIIAALLERAIEKAGYPMEWSDRFWVVLGWPLASAIFIYSFIKGFFGKD